MSAYNVPIPNPGNTPFNSSEYTANDYTSIPTTGGTMTGNLTVPSINITNSTASTSILTGCAILTGGLAVGSRINAGGALAIVGALSGCTTIASSGINTLTNSTQSTAFSNGSFVCSGGLGVAKDIFTNGKLTIVGPLAGCTTINSSGINTLTDSTQSTAYTNGSFICSGGLGVAKDIFTNGKLTIVGPLAGCTTIASSGINTLTDSTQSTAYTNGSFICSGGLGIAKDIFTNGKLTIVGAIDGCTTLAASGAVTFTAGVASTTTTSGSLVVTGGVGISAALNCATAGIGAVSTGYPLQLGFVTQTIAASYGYLNSGGSTGTGSNTGAQNFSMYANGRIAATGEIELVSDRKLKENIIDISDEEAEAMFKIKPKKYNKIGFDNKEFGYISQDIGKVVPELVNIIIDKGQPEFIDEDGFVSPKDHIITVNYQKVICLLHRKIQLMDLEIKKISGGI